MPTYTYFCSKCGHTFDLFLPIGKAHRFERCEKCDNWAKRQMGTPGILFKGSGFYENDYKKAGKKRKST